METKDYYYPMDICDYPLLEESFLTEEAWPAETSRIIMEPHYLDCIEEVDEEAFEDSQLQRRKKKKKKKFCKTDLQSPSFKNDQAYEEDPTRNIEAMTSEEREGRRLARSNSLRRRDTSWDKKWQEHIGKNADEMSRSSVFGKAPRQPSKVNRKLWESPRSLPPNIPQRILRPSTASPKPHHGASAMDYSPGRVATPPLDSTQTKYALIPMDYNRMASTPTLDSASSRTSTPTMPKVDSHILPPPPPRVATPPYPVMPDSSIGLSETPLPSPPAVVVLDDNESRSGSSRDGRWKDQMRDEILRARSSLLASKESAKVESVIRLLEQTYERLQDEGEENVVPSAKQDANRFHEGALPSTPLLLLSNGVHHGDDLLHMKEQLECVITATNGVDEDVGHPWTDDDGGRSPVALSRSISGTFQAIPATIVAEEEMMDQVEGVKKEQQHKMRKEFINSMLKTDEIEARQFKMATAANTIEEQTRQRKEDLMTQIKTTVQEVPAVDEVFTLAPQHATAEDLTCADDNSITIVAHDPHRDTPELPLTFVDEQEQSGAMFKLDKPCRGCSTTGSQAILTSFANHPTTRMTTIQAASVKVNQEPSGGSSSSPEKMKAAGPQDSKLKMYEATQIVDKPIMTITQASAKMNQEPFGAGNSSPEKMNAAGQQDFKLKMYEATQREKIFSISGMWSHVKLGLVKERSSFWQNCTEDEPRRRMRPPNYKIQPQQKRQSRVIDPNEWISGDSTIHTTRETLHKSVSTGHLEAAGVDTSEDCQVPLLMSQATVTWEQRANGRKSADIFVAAAEELPSSEETVTWTESKLESQDIISETTCNVEATIDEEETMIQEGCTNVQTEDATTQIQESCTSIKTKSQQTEDEITTQIQESCTNIKTKSQQTEDETTTQIQESCTNVKTEEETKNQIHWTESQTVERLSEIIGDKSSRTMMPPLVPGRTTSKFVVKEKLNQQQKRHSPSLNLLNVSIAPQMSSSPDSSSSSPKTPVERRKELQLLEEKRRKFEENEKKQKLQQEQERRFHQRIEIEQRLRQRQAATTLATDDAAPTPPPPPQVDYQQREASRKMDKLRSQELKERMKLKEMEGRKRDIEEEISRERQHLAELQRLEQSRDSTVKVKSKPKAVTQNETMVSEQMGAAALSPPPVPPRPGAAMTSLDQMEQQRATELDRINSLREQEALMKKELDEFVQARTGRSNISNGSDQRISFEETMRDLEITTKELKELAEKKMKNHAAERRTAPGGDGIKEAAGAVRDMAQALLSAISRPDTEAGHSEDETEGYSEGGEEISCGLEMPIGGNEQSSGNVTPIPTEGELEDISVEEFNTTTSPRRTPLKSLLKKQSFDADDIGCETLSLPGEQMTIERSCSPKKAVHFSEIDQIKLMSQESLVSTAPSDTSNFDRLTVTATQTACSPAAANKTQQSPATRNQALS